MMPLLCLVLLSETLVAAVHLDMGNLKNKEERGIAAPTIIVARVASVDASVFQGRKKQHKHKLFGPDFPRTFLTLTPGCPGVKKFLPITGAAEKRTLVLANPTKPCGDWSCGEGGV